MEEKDNVLTLTDEEGNEVDFVVVNAVEYNGKTYVMLVEADKVEDDEAEALMLRVEDNGEEDILVTVDDEDEFEAVSAEFEKSYEEGDEYELQAEEEHPCDCGCDHCHKE
ncbi:MAG: DUF1292 domain-containing protein [Clostridia bacterium]|nr:DUF1292 domain-containing protein [Clostridia bacterium]